MTFKVTGFVVSDIFQHDAFFLEMTVSDLWYKNVRDQR
jgi:hypothetical protein